MEGSGKVSSGTQATLENCGVNFSGPTVYQEEIRVIRGTQDRCLHLVAPYYTYDLCMVISWCLSYHNSIFNSTQCIPAAPNSMSSGQ